MKYCPAIECDNIDDLYLHVCDELISSGERVGNTLELRDLRLRVNDISNSIVSIRNISDVYLFAELLWYFTGRNDVEFIGTFASMWNDISDNGITNNSAYGYLMKYRYDFDQIDKVVELLCKSPDSRRAVINLNVPNKDVIETKDEPCTIALQFLIRDGKLHCTSMIRSNDIWFGFPYDVAFFTELQKVIADRLHVGYGSYTHFVTSMHLYNRDIGKVKKILENPISMPINFNRKNFHNNTKLIAELLQVTIRHHREGARDMLLSLLDTFDVYHRNKEKLKV